MKADLPILPRSSFPAPARGLLAGLILISLVLSPVITGCRKQEPFRETMFLMGTLVEIAAYPDTREVRDAVALAFRRMEKVESLADQWEEDSPFARLRRGEGSDLSPEMLQVLEVALKVARMSSGVFDPTMGELVDLWGFERGSHRVPGSDRISEAMASMGYERLSMSGGGVKVNGQPVWLELGGVAKGYAVDEAVRVLKKSGVRAGIVNAGGDLRAFGKKPGGKPWRIGVQDPDDPQGMVGVLTVEDAAVATSGDYERYFEVDGVRYHHILDPATGRPSRSGVRGVTVVAPDCVLADALATAVFVLQQDQGRELLGRQNDVEGAWVLEDGRILTTPGIGTVIEFERR